MPDDPLSNAQRELQALNRRRASLLGKQVGLPTPVAGVTGLALSVGARVLDLVTGQEGVIIDATAEHIITGSASVTAG